MNLDWDPIDNPIYSETLIRPFFLNVGLLPRLYGCTPAQTVPYSLWQDVVQFKYNANKQVVQTTFQRNPPITFYTIFNTLGSPVKVTGQDPTTRENYTLVTFEYDSQGRLSKWDGTVLRAGAIRFFYNFTYADADSVHPSVIKRSSTDTRLPSDTIRCQYSYDSTGDMNGIQLSAGVAPDSLWKIGTDPATPGGGLVFKANKNSEYYNFHPLPGAGYMDLTTYDVNYSKLANFSATVSYWTDNRGLASYGFNLPQNSGSFFFNPQSN
mgnify:CR=1 FL=1